MMTGTFSNSSSAGPIVVLSDLHFGEPDATLTCYNHTRRTPAPRQKNTLDVLFDYLRNLQPIDELLLLGDTFEIWRFPWSDTVRHSKQFFSELQQLDIGQIGFTYGNHDHPLLFQFEYWDQTGRRDAGPRYHSNCFAFLFDHFIRPLFPASMQYQIFCFYPFYTRTIGARTISFHHGHYLKYLPLTSVITSLMNLRTNTSPDSLHEMEKRWTLVFWGSRYLGFDTAARRRIHDSLEANYVKFLSSMSVRITRGERSRPASWVPNSRIATIENYAEDVKNLLRVAKAEGYPGFSEISTIESFIFGHTHHVGTWRSEIEGIPSLVNIGCWTAEKLPMERALNTFAVVYDNRTELCRASDSGVDLLESLDFRDTR
jgi:UDP-2,3-diacylglucosamine pyrophosphatase LpxH